MRDKKKLTKEQKKARAGVIFTGDEPTNADRAERGARTLLDFYAFEYGEDESNLRDLLADLMHHADNQGLDFNNELRIARDHYEAEKEDEG
jgi:hypothetical protein